MRNNLPKRIRSFDECQSMNDYYRYMREQGLKTPVPHIHLEIKRRETYDRILKKEAIEYRKNKKK